MTARPFSCHIHLQLQVARECYVEVLIGSNDVWLCVVDSISGVA